MIKRKKKDSKFTRSEKSAKSLRKQKRRASKKEKEQPGLWIPSGSIMMNLACSDRWYGGYKAGTMVNTVGDSGSGKSFLGLSGLAEAFYMGKSGRWKDYPMPDLSQYRLIYDDSEYANSFNMVKLFGQEFVDVLEGPDPDDSTKFSTTIEEFEINIWNAIEDGRPFIYLQDSFDAIDSEDEKEKSKDNREKRKKGEKTKGSYQATKQKTASRMFREITNELAKTKSVLNIISQTRDNLSGMGFQTKYRAGGKALKFFSSIESWVTYIGSIKKVVNGNKFEIGVNTRVKFGKNKYTGKRREPDFVIYYDYGIDDIGSCIDFLLKNGYWKKKKQTIVAPELSIKKTKPEMIKRIERKENLKIKLFESTQKCWNKIEESLKLDRRKF
jgi:RecA/RadA recombinase